MKTLKNYLQEHYKGESIQSYYLGIQKYLRYVTNPEKSELQDILNYIKTLRKQGYKPRTLQIQLAHIKAYYSYLQQIGQRKDHPCKELQLKDKIDKSIKTELLYTEKQLEDYLEQTLTIQELVNLKIQDIDIEKAEINLKNRTLKLKGKQIYLLIEQLQTCQKDKIYLFEHSRTPQQKLRAKWINQYINYKREKKFTPIKIRQSVIKNLLKKDDLRKVQVFAGHKKSSITQAYQTSDLEQLKEDINKLHPLS